MDREGWGSNIEKIYKSSGLLKVGASGALGIKEGLEGKEKGDASSVFLVKISDILGSEKGRDSSTGHGEGERALSTYYVPAPRWALSQVLSHLIFITIP